MPGSIAKITDQTVYKQIYSFECTSSSAGTLDTGTPSVEGVSGRLLGVKIAPHTGATAPSAGFDFQLRGSDLSEDLLAGAAASLSASAVKRINTGLPYLNNEDLTLYAIDCGASKKFDVEIYVDQEGA